VAYYEKWVSHLALQKAGQVAYNAGGVNRRQGGRATWPDEGVRRWACD
jgi:hypothetical protein